MQRGDVYLCRSLLLPNRDPVPLDDDVTPKDKLVVILNDGAITASTTEVAVVIASTHIGLPKRSFEVILGTADGLRWDTVIDCRWPYTLRQGQIAAGRRITTLSSARMHEVSLALVVGLQLS
jgi:mRNA-degrading endonuclease toxin of MazEF toxin-antitoxin module